MIEWPNMPPVSPGIKEGYEIQLTKKSTKYHEQYVTRVQNGSCQRTIIFDVNGQAWDTSIHVKMYMLRYNLKVCNVDRTGKYKKLLCEIHSRPTSRTPNK